jgi:hypothetical protein
MHTITGTWDVRLKTPIGTLETRYTFTEDGGTLAGTAEGQGETGTLEAITVEPTTDGSASPGRRRSPGPCASTSTST